ncbi:MAG: amino acid adenylation domain-containing protein [Candidatus Sulfotelmatobacter sp.]|jgi:aspartate racemase
MSSESKPVSRLESPGAALSLYHLLDPEVLANPYPLFHRLRREAPVHWDSFLHAWIVTRYVDVVEVLQSFSADRTPTPEHLTSMGLSQLSPMAELMVKQMLFMDAPAHTRLRGLASKAFTPARIQVLKEHIREIVDRLLAAVQENGGMDVIADLAEPLPAIVTAEMLGVPVSDHRKLKAWSANFAEMLGNFQHNPDHAKVMVRTVEEMTAYFRNAVEEQKQHPTEGLIHSLLTAEIDGDRLSDDEIVANTIITMVGGQETTTNLIGNGVLTLLRYPEQMQKLRDDLSLIPSAVEEMLRFESPSQHTARLALDDRELGGKLIRKRQAVIAVMAAANRDPDRFPDPDRFDITRQDNRHLAFGYAAHFCFGAPLARMEGQIVFEALLRAFSNLQLEPQALTWRTNLGLRGLRSLRVKFDARGKSASSGTRSSLAQGSLENEIKPESNAANYPAKKCVHDLVSDRAAQTPESIAVIHGDQQLTFRELNDRANQLADYLAKKGIRKDVPVGICLKRSLELTVALLGVMKAGGACLPLDPDYPDERLAYMLADSQAPVLLTQPGLLPRLGDAKPEVVHFRSDWKILEGCSPENPARSSDPSSLAYVIYTSGSTGQPRGVMLEHCGLVNHHVAAIELYDLEPSDRTLQFSSLSFDIAIEEIFPTWIAGGTVVLRTEGMPLAGSDFLQWIRQRGITVLDLPTAYWHELVRALMETGEKLPPSLRLLIVGGEKASSSAFASWVGCGGGRVRWVNTYGPTEASIIVTSYEPDPAQPVAENLPIGRAIANTRLYILDEQRKPVPVGAPGELYISGPGVARGYLGRPELTAEKFIVDSFTSDSFTSEQGRRMYRTGDLARYLQDGNIEFLGRADFQVKIRGFRVELGEIEAVLEKHPGVASAVVVAHESNGEKRLAGYVIATDPKPSGGELSKYLKDWLPEYMVPADFVFLETMPLTPNGKVDRRALPRPQVSTERGADFVAPRNEFESIMTRQWEQVLGKRPIGVRDNFFEIGGHSLAAARLMGMVGKEFGKKLLLTDLLQAPTIEELVALVRLETPSAARSAVIALQPLGSKPPLFFVHGLGGSVLRFRDLARHMAPGQPFFGIQAQGLDGTQPCLQRVEDMADVYLEHLRSAQPEGPYYLGGYSFGGYVALEMARRLQAQGEEIRALVLLDTYAVESKSVFERFLSLSTEQKIAYLKRRMRRYQKGIKRRIDFTFLPAAVKNVRRTLAAAENNYKLEAYSGRILLFRASEKGLRGLEDPTGGWHKYVAGGLEVHEIDGDHGDVLDEPNVESLARELRDCLERAQSEPSSRVSTSEPLPQPDLQLN